MNEKVLAVSVSLVVAIVYFTGFCYLYFYYLVFGITPLELDLSVQYVFVHAFPVLWFFVLHFTAAFFFTVVTVCFTSYRFRNRINSNIGEHPFLFMVVFLFFAIVCSYNAALYSGRMNAEAGLRKFPPLFLTFKSGSNVAGMQTDMFKDLRHIITTKDTVFALKFSGNGSDFWAIRIPTQSIDLSNVYMD